MNWDVFISHASEDKATVARPLARILQRAGVRVWLDESELRVGDSLRGKIDEGLARSQFGVVILSQSFFAKDWPKRELGALFSRREAILPIWHGIGAADVASHSPLLADIIAESTSDGLMMVARRIIQAIRDRSGNQIIRCNCEPIYSQVSDAILSARGGLPSGIAQYVLHVAEMVRVLGDNATICCNFRQTAQRCAATLTLLTGFLRQTVQGFNETKMAKGRDADIEYKRILSYRASIADWCANVERVIEQRSTQLSFCDLSYDFDSSAGESAGWLVANIEELVNIYAVDILKTNGPPSFVVLVAPKESVVSTKGNSFLLLPPPDLENIPELMPHLWHLVGRHAFILRYSFDQFMSLTHQNIEEARLLWEDLASIYGDVTTLAHAFNYDVRIFSVSTAEALFKSWAFQEAGEINRDRFVAHLMFRLFFAVEFATTVKQKPRSARLTRHKAATIIHNLAKLLESAVLPSFGMGAVSSSVETITLANVMTSTAKAMRRVVYQLRDLLPEPSITPLPSELTVSRVVSGEVDRLSPSSANRMMAFLVDRPQNLRHNANMLNRSGAYASTEVLMILRAVSAYLNQNEIP